MQITGELNPEGGRQRLWARRRTSSHILPGNVRKLNLAVTAVCLLLPGCHERSDLDRLVADGATACATASEYYDQLGAMTVEAWQNEAAFKALAGGTASKESQDVFQQRLDALARRFSTGAGYPATRMVPWPHCARRAD